MKTMILTACPKSWSCLKVSSMLITPVIFDPETFRHDVSEWGRLLSDIAQHVANAVEMDGQMNRNEALAQLHDAFDLNMHNPDLAMSGKIKGRTEH